MENHARLTISHQHLTAMGNLLLTWFVACVHARAIARASAHRRVRGTCVGALERGVGERGARTLRL